MKIIKHIKDLDEKWDNFCLKNNGAWFWHTADFISYSAQIRPAMESVSESFSVLDEDKSILALCPILVETVVSKENGSAKELSFGGYPLPAPVVRDGLTKKRSNQIFDLIFACVDEIANRYSVRRASFRFSPLAPDFTGSLLPKYNYLMKYGYLDISLNTQVIDLSLSSQELENNLRKGHACDIKRGSSLLISKVYDASSISEKIFSEYCRLHHKAAGRVTRPQATFQMMYDWIKTNKAILISAEQEGSFLGFSLVILYKKGAYYGSGAYHPEHEDLPLAHLLQWEAIKWLKEKGFLLYETGWQQFGRQLYDMSSRKELNIAHFKRGFGGRTVPLFMGEKFYSEPYFRQVQQERIEKYISESFKPGASD